MNRFPEDTIPPLAGSIDEIDAFNLPPVLSAIATTIPVSLTQRM